MASGFSQRTCFPARAAAIAHARVQVVGQRDVHGVDVGIGQQGLVRSVRPRDAQLRATARRGASSREAIATTLPRVPRRTPGIHFSRRDDGGREDAPAQPPISHPVSSSVLGG